MESYHWRGNIRQLKNVAEQISAIEESRNITADILRRYLPNEGGNRQPMTGNYSSYDDMSERELLYKILFDMRNDINELKRMMTAAMSRVHTPEAEPVRRDVVGLLPPSAPQPRYEENSFAEVVEDDDEREITKEDVQREQILRALRNNNYRRKETAKELFISERTLYRKMKALGIDDDIK